MRIHRYLYIHLSDERVPFKYLLRIPDRIKMYIHLVPRDVQKTRSQDMNYLVPNYLFPYVLTGAFAALAAVVFGVHKALKLAGWPVRDRQRTVCMAAVLLGGWFSAALLTSWFGLYRT